MSFRNIYAEDNRDWNSVQLLAVIVTSDHTSFTVSLSHTDIKVC